MNRRQLLWTFLIAVVLTVLSIFLFDQPIAAFVQRAGGRESRILQEGTHWLEIASGLPIARYFLAYLLLGGAALLFIAKSTRPPPGCSCSSGLLTSLLDWLRAC